MNGWDSSDNSRRIMSPEQFNFIGKPEYFAEKRISAAMRRTRSTIEMHPDERGKTKDEKEFIAYTNVLIEHERERLGVDAGEIMSPNRVRMIAENRDNLEENSEKSDTHSCVFGEYWPVTGRAYVYDDALRDRKKVNRLGTILHECLHAASCQKYALGKDNVSTYRIGYATKHPDQERQKLVAFNEGLTEVMVWDLLGQKSEYLRKRFEIQEKDVSPSHGGYIDSQYLILLLSKRVAGKLEKSKTEVYCNFKRGYFTGEMMHLRDIEKAFGPGALAIVDMMVALPKTKEAIGRNEKIFQFFETDSEDEREQLRDELLPEQKKMLINRRSERRAPAL